MHRARRDAPLRWLTVVAVCATAAAVLDAGAAPGARRGEGPGPWCGGALWRQMAFSDPDRAKVDVDPMKTTIAAIAALDAPKKTTLARTTAYQLHAWRVHAVIDRYRIASNGEIVLVLFSIDSGKYMNAYLPNPSCLSANTRLRTAILDARKALTRRCPAVRSAWQLLGISTQITGVGFWNPTRTTRGALANGAELRPVIDLTIDSGCGMP
jgi:hypothetical protein